MIVFLDLETTGLDPHTDLILEIGFVVVDDSLEEIASFSGTISTSATRAALANADEIVKKMHRESGLFDEIMHGSANHSSTLEEARDTLAGSCSDLKKAPLGGFSPHFDREFLKYAPNRWQGGPAIVRALSHRNFDVSTLVRATQYLGGRFEKPSAPYTHRALDDCRCAIATTKAFVERFKAQ